MVPESRRSSPAINLTFSFSIPSVDISVVILFVVDIILIGFDVSGDFSNGVILVFDVLVVFIVVLSFFFVISAL